jgi:hypothetical protein
MMAVARRGEDYQVKFHGVASFVIGFDQRRIQVFPTEACPQSTCVHLLLDQVIPRTLCHLGRMVVHASAVELPDGRAVAFTGPSGQGKSTLATAFFRAGHGLISDDCLLLETRQGEVQVVASYPSLRLWPDSAGEMVDDGSRFSEMAHYTNKKQLLLNSGDAPEQPRWNRLSALYILEDPARPGPEQPVAVTPAGGMASIMALISSLFALDVVAEKSVRRGFETVRKVASGVSISRLAYPREYRFLPDVMETVISETGQSGEFTALKP